MGVIMTRLISWLEAMGEDTPDTVGVYDKKLPVFLVESQDFLSFLTSWRWFWRSWRCF